MKNQQNILCLSGLVFLAVMSRLLPHPLHFTPFMAVALFSGTFFNRWAVALLVPLASLFLSDLILGLHTQIIPVYFSFALVVAIGKWVAREGNEWKKLGKRLPLGVLSSSFLFFLISNFFVWALDNLYPMTFEGLIHCYVMALPFMHRELASNLFFSTFLYGMWIFLLSPLLLISNSNSNKDHQKTFHQI